MAIQTVPALTLVALPLTLVKACTSHRSTALRSVHVMIVCMRCRVNAALGYAMDIIFCNLVHLGFDAIRNGLVFIIHSYVVLATAPRVYLIDKNSTTIVTASQIFILSAVNHEVDALFVQFLSGYG